MVRPLPSGIWAVASELAGAKLDAWMEGVQPAAAWTFRRPPSDERATRGDLIRMRAAAPWLAVHGQFRHAQAARADALIAGVQSHPWAELAKVCSQDCPDLALGASVHSIAEWQEARDQLEASFMLLGPIFDTPSKRGILEPLGLDRLREYVALEIPMIAIGGIDTPEDAVAAKAAGAHAVAVLRAAQDRVRFAEMCAAWKETSTA